MTRTEKNKELHYLLKRESEQIKYIIDNAIEDNYEDIFNEMMGNPIEKLNEIFKLGGKDESNNNS